uniref:Uncharacterized protein n=1 Tax=Callorhinchus milii TaxID=7868 RepID=A0A4W3JUL5_CALMI
MAPAQLTSKIQRYSPARTALPVGVWGFALVGSFIEVHWINCKYVFCSTPALSVNNRIEKKSKAN